MPFTLHMHDVQIRSFAPSDTDWLVETHQDLYAREEDFDATFGPLVRRILETYVANHDPADESGWIACNGPQRLGSIFCMRHTETTAKLRLFLLTPDARGHGLGQRLLTTCMRYAKERGYRDMTLWTHESHRAACALYAKNGWTLTESTQVTSFGQNLTEQTWTLKF